MSISGKRILVVDDEDSLRRNFAALLGLEGAIAYPLANGAEAVRWLEENTEGCDAVIMDLQMPVMDGMTATKYIREVLGIAELPIIAVTGQSLHKIEKEALQAGFTHVLEKPVKFNELLQTIGQLLHLKNP